MNFRASLDDLENKHSLVPAGNQTRIPQSFKLKTNQDAAYADSCHLYPFICAWMVYILQLSIQNSLRTQINAIMIMVSLLIKKKTSEMDFVEI